MPVVPGQVGPFAGQASQTSVSPATQSTFRQMCGEIAQWRPDVPDTMIELWIRNAYRSIVDDRLWYGLLIQGVFTSMKAMTTGTVTVDSGSDSVTGVGVTWNDSLVGSQFRTGFTSPYYTIIGVPDSTHLKLDTVFGGASVSGRGYMIASQLANLGPNVKRVKTMLNQLQGYRLRVDVPREQIDAKDTWRTSVGYTRVLAGSTKAADGSPRWELWPTPTAQQPFPFLAYVQPPDLDDDVFPVAWVRSDLIVKSAMSHALLFRGANKDPVTANWMRAEFNQEMQKMRDLDDNFDLKNLTWQFEQFPMAPGGMWAQEHDV